MSKSVEQWQDVARLAEKASHDNPDRDAAFVACFELNAAGITLLPKAARQLLAIRALIDGKESVTSAEILKELGEE